MSYGEYKFGDFARHYNVGGPSDGLVGFAEGFAKGFVPTYMAANKAARDKDLALAKLDKQAENDAAKAKTTANNTYKENRKSAADLVSGVVIPDGISEADLIIWTAGQLDAGRTPTSVGKDLREGIAGGLFEYEGGGTPDPTPSATPEAAPAPVDTGPTTPLDRQMNEALGEQTSSDTTSEEPESDLQPLLSSVDAEADDGSYQEASLGNDWEARFRERTQKKNEDNAGTLVASLDTQTDVTNPAGLGGGDEPTSQIVLTGGEGTPSDRLAATTGALRLRPAAKAATAEELDVSKVDDYDKALAAQVALTGVAGQEEKKARVNFLLDQFTKMPKLGDMNSQQLQEFIASAETDPQYANLDSQVLSGTISRAEGYLEDLNKKELPSLTETDLTKLQGVQADIASGRYSFDISQEYTNQLAGRISALEAKAEAERIAGITFNEAYVEKLALLKYEEIQSNPDLNAGQKIAAMQQWMDTEGKQLQQLLRFGDKPEKPQEINNLEELSTQNLMNSEEYKAASPERQQEMVLALKASLSGQKKDTLTSSEYAAEYAQKTLDLSSEDPAVAAAAQSWFDNVAPALAAGMQAAATASAKPGEQKSVTITYETPDGQTRRASGIPTETGYTLADGTNIPKKSVQSTVSEDDRDYTTKLRTSISGPRTKQRDNMNAMVDLSQQAYALEELAVNDPVVLTLVGAGTSAVSTAKREANTLFTLLQSAAEKGFEQGISSQSVVERVMVDFLKANKVTDETAANYKQFAAKLTRFIFAAGKTLGQEGNGFSNQDYTNILASLKAGNGVEAFVNNMRSFVRERSVFTNAGAVGLNKMSEVAELKSYGVDLGIETMTYEEYSQSDFAPEDFAAWLNSPIDSLKRDKEPAATSTAPLQRGADGVFRLTTPGGDN